MQGQLADTTIVDLCLRLAGQATTGSLAVAASAGSAHLAFTDGHLAAGQVHLTSPSGSRLGERLVAIGRLDPASLEDVLAEQDADPASVPLGQRLVDRGLVSRDVVRLCLQEQALAALQEVAGWMEGTWDLQPTPPMGGVIMSMPVDRALREVARRTVDRQQMALQQVGQPADRESTTPPREEFDLSAPPTTGTRPAVPTDGGWTHRVDASPQGAVDEPEPWVGWANGAARAAPQAPAQPPQAPAEPSAPSQVAPPAPAPEAPAAHTPAPVEPPPPVADARAPADETPRPAPAPMDADTRRELFSALHEVGQATPARSEAPMPVAPPAQPDEPAAAPEAAEVGEVEVPAPAPPSSLSRSDVSELLAELHALNLDDDGRG